VEEEEDEEEPAEKEESPKKVKAPTEQAPEPSSLPEPESSSKGKLGPSIPAEFLAKFYDDPLNEEDDDDLEPKEPKRQRVRTRHNKVSFP